MLRKLLLQKNVFSCWALFQNLLSFLSDKWCAAWKYMHVKYTHRLQLSNDWDSSHKLCFRCSSSIWIFTCCTGIWNISLFLLLSPPWNEAFGRKRRFYQNLNLVINIDISCSSVIIEHGLAENGFPELTKHYFHKCHLIWQRLNTAIVSGCVKNQPSAFCLCGIAFRSVDTVEWGRMLIDRLCVWGGVIDKCVTGDVCFRICLVLVHEHSESKH